MDSIQIFTAGSSIRNTLSYVTIGKLIFIPHHLSHSLAQLSTKQLSTVIFLSVVLFSVPCVLPTQSPNLVFSQSAANKLSGWHLVEQCNMKELIA